MNERLVNRKDLMPRTKEQFNEIREKTKSLILRCSLELFAEQGFNGTSMADIAKKAGVSKGLAYSYFKSKQEILRTMLEDLLETKFSAIAFPPVEPGSQNPSYDILINIIEKSFEFVTTDESSLRLYLRLLLQPTVMESTQEFKEKFQGRIALIWKEYIQIFTDLGYDDPITEVYFLSTMMNGICLEYLSHGKEYPLEKMKEKLIQRYAEKKRS
jgi:AcrR family transcriptional regulator